MDKEKLHKYALNKISDPAEIEEIVNWIEASPENRREYNNIKNLWSYTTFGNYNSLANIKAEKVSERKRTKVLRLEILKYAAVFILAFIIGGALIYFTNTRVETQLAYNEVIVPYGESAEVILPDSTHVWLNSGTRLSYPTSFMGKNRDVKLTGEAFFDVKHNPQRPFHVFTPALTVEVLGTSFNVEAFEKTDIVNVTLVEGKVNIQDENGKLLTRLAPNENARYDVSRNRIYVSQVDTSFYTSWKQGVLMFKDEKLVDIAKRLERWYNVKIVFDEKSVEEIKFSGSILKNKPIDQILAILKYTSGVDYSIVVKDAEPNLIHLKLK